MIPVHVIFFQKVLEFHWTFEQEARQEVTRVDNDVVKVEGENQTTPGPLI